MYYLLSHIELISELCIYGVDLYFNHFANGYYSNNHNHHHYTMEKYGYHHEPKKEQLIFKGLYRNLSDKNKIFFHDNKYTKYLND